MRTKLDDIKNRYLDGVPDDATDVLFVEDMTKIFHEKLGESLDLQAALKKVLWVTFELAYMAGVLNGGKTKKSEKGKTSKKGSNSSFNNAAAERVRTTGSGKRSRTSNSQRRGRTSALSHSRRYAGYPPDSE